MLKHVVIQFVTGFSVTFVMRPEAYSTPRNRTGVISDNKRDGRQWDSEESSCVAAPLWNWRAEASFVVWFLGPV